MTTTTIEALNMRGTQIYRCPLCGMVLDPLSDDLRCPICQLDQEEKLADYRAEQEQAWFPL